jgi:hypothetical protein
MLHFHVKMGEALSSPGDLTKLVFKDEAGGKIPILPVYRYWRAAAGSLLLMRGHFLLELVMGTPAT